MNKLVVGIVSGLIGATVGAIGGYIYARKTLEDEFESSLNESLEEELERLRAEHQELLDKETAIQKKKRESLDQEMQDLNAYKKAMYISKKQIKNGEVPDIDFSGLSSTATIIESAQPQTSTEFGIPKSYEEVQQAIAEKRRRGELEPDSDDEDDEDDTPSDEQPIDQPDDDDSIEIITMMEYANLPHWYSVVNMDYTMEDGVLVDEDGSILDDPETYIGEEALTIDSPGSIFVRNDRLKLAIEVQFLDTNYETYMGEST